MDKNADLAFNISAISNQQITSNIRFSTQDEGSAKLTFYLYKDGVALPLNAVEGKLAMRMADGSIFRSNIVIVDKVNGVAEHSLTTEQIKHYGRVNAELYLNYENNQKMSVHRFSFTIERALIDADISLLAEFYVDDFSNLRETINVMAEETTATIQAVGESVEQAKGKADETIALIQQNKAAKQSDLDVANTNLATIDEKVGPATEYGEVPQSVAKTISQRGLNLKDFGAKGNANYYNALDGNWYADSLFSTPANDDTLAIKSAVAYIESTRVGKFIYPKGRFLVSDSVVHTKRALTVGGMNTHDSKLVVAKNFGGGVKKKPVLFFYSGSPSYAIDKITVSQLGFDATADNMDTRGIQFEYLIYTSGFEYLDFEGFSGAVIASEGLGNDVSEMITFHQIRAQPRGKTRVEPTFSIKKTNEVAFINNRLFAKENGASTITDQPLLYLKGCQGVHINGQNSFFYADGAPAIKVISEDVDNVSQGIFIGGNTFEKCNYKNLIEITGKGSGASLATTDVEITRNRYNSSGKKLSITNVINAVVLDTALNVDMNSGVDGCTVLTNSTFGLVVNDTSGLRNAILDIGSDYNSGKITSRTKQYDTYAQLLSAAVAEVRLKSVNTPTGKYMGIRASVINGDWARRELQLLCGDEAMAAVTMYGFAIKVTTGVLPTSGIKEGTMCIRSDNNTLNVFLNGGWKSTPLT